MSDLFDAKKAKELGGRGLLTEQDLRELADGVRRVYELMKDGEWYTPDAICMAAGQGGKRAGDGLRRMRQLREKYQVEKRRLGGDRIWVYRLVLPKPAAVAQ